MTADTFDEILELVFGIMTSYEDNLSKRSGNLRLFIAPNFVKIISVDSMNNVEKNRHVQKYTTEKLFLFFALNFFFQFLKSLHKFHHSSFYKFALITLACL